MADRGTCAPRLLPPPAPAGWARAEVADWLLAQPPGLLAGFDFSFAPPFVDRDCYLPGLPGARDGPGFWAEVEQLSDDPDLGGHGFMTGAARPHFWMGAADGPKAPFLRFRQCERLFNASGGGKAATLFDCVGAAQVAKASFAGMRVLHRLRGPYAIWPFDAPGPRTVVEIYGRAMLRHAGGRGLKLRDATSLNTALAALDSEPVQTDAPLSDHQTDALVSAAALRRLSDDPRWWTPPALSSTIAQTEGWTFGIA